MQMLGIATLEDMMKDVRRCLDLFIRTDKPQMLGSFVPRKFSVY